nr:retrovirus-related Pol polyprotein from transposon TNT 1-94 [Tanacetum cinerariifolium]
MSCLSDDIMESVISCVLAKETWTDLVHSFEDPSDTKENRIMGLKLEYQTFRAKSTESLSQTYTRCKTLLNELANDGVNLSKHEINVGFVNSLPEKWLTFSQGLRNANHTQTRGLANIYGRFVCEDNLIQRSLLLTQNNQANLKFQKDYKAKYKKMKAKLALLEASLSSSHNPKTFQPMNKADDELTVRKNHACNGEWVDITMRKVNTLLSMDEDADWQNYLKRILVPESQVVNKFLKTLNAPESFKDSEAGFLTPLPPLKNLLGASPSSEKQVREPIWYLDSECSRSKTGVKSYLHKYVEQPGPKFDDKQETVFNANKEIILIAPRRNDVYVLDMSSLTPNGACFFAKASKSVNWLWHKRSSHLNFKNINKLAKQNKVLSLPSLVYLKDKACTSCEKEKHHRASFKTKQNFSIKKCLHLLYMDLFGPVSPMYINHEKYTLVIVDEYSRERIPDICYFHVFGCPVFIHNNKDHLGKFDAKADDGYFLGYSFVSKAFKVFNTNRQQVEETYHVTFNESMKAIRFTNTSVDKIGIDDSSRYLPDEFQEDDPSRQYQVDSDASYYIIPHGCSLTEITQENHVPEVIDPNEPEIPHTKDTEGPPDLIDTKGTYEQNVQNDQMITQPTDAPSGNNSEGFGSITKSLVLDVTQSHISNQASTTSHPAPRDRWSKDQHIELVNIIGNPVEGMLTRSMAAMQEEINQFYRNKVWTLVPLPYRKIAICSKWVFRNKKDEHDITTKNKARLVAQGYSQEEGINYDETFTPDDKGILIFQEQSTRNLLKKYKISDSSSVKTPMVPPNNLGPDLAGKPVNDTSYRRMIGSLIYLTETRHDIQFFTVLCAIYQSNPKESHLTTVKRILRYLKGTPTLGLYYLKCSGFDLKGYSDYACCNMDKKVPQAEYVVAAGCCASIVWIRSQLGDYDIHYKMVPIFCDNTSVIAISNNLVLHSRTKHIDIRYYFIRDHILKGDIKLHFISTEYQLADIFTKPLDEPTLTRLKAELGMLNID